MESMEQKKANMENQSSGVDNARGDYLRYQMLVQTIPDIIFEISSEGRFVFVSSAIESLGYSSEDLIGKHFKEIVHPKDYSKVSRVLVLPKFIGEITGDDNAPKLFDERRTGPRMTKGLQVRILENDTNSEVQKFRYSEMSSSGHWDKPIEKEKKEFLGSIGVIRDITSRKESELKLQAALNELQAKALSLQIANKGIKKLYKKMEMQNIELQKIDQIKSDFISVVSHEMRTPLTVIKESMAVILEGLAGDVNEKQKRILSSAKSNIDRLTRIINDLLDVSKIESGKIKFKREKVNLRELFTNVLLPFEQKAKLKGLDFILDLSGDNLEAYVDADQIVRVINNLVGNSLKFTEKGFVKVSINEDADLYKCSVEDTGHGIKESDLPRLFNKFEQFAESTSEGGTGLGLYIVKNIVDMHKGKISVDSRFGRGTKITFAIPKYTEEEFFYESIETSIKAAKTGGFCTSYIICKIDTHEKKDSPAIKELMADINLYSKDELRYGRDMAVNFSNVIVYILSECEKKAAEKVLLRLQKTVETYLNKHGLQDKYKYIFNILTYPNQIQDKQKLVETLKGYVS